MQVTSKIKLKSGKEIELTEEELQELEEHFTTIQLVPYDIPQYVFPYIPIPQWEPMNPNQTYIR